MKKEVQKFNVSWEKSELETLLNLRNEGKSYSEIAVVLGRTTSATSGIGSIIAHALRITDEDSLNVYLTKKHLGAQTAESIVALWRTSQTITPEVNTEPAVNQPEESNFEQAVDMLDQTVEQLNGLIETTIKLGIEREVDQQQELKTLLAKSEQEKVILQNQVNDLQEQLKELQQTKVTPKRGRFTNLLKTSWLNQR